MAGLVALLLASVCARSASAQGTSAQASGQTEAQAGTRQVYLDDRGTGIPTSMFGTYIRKGELILYPFYEHYRGNNYEYKPEELGVPGDQDFRGRYRADESIFYLGYGIGDHVAVEFEAAVLRAWLDKAPTDSSRLPARLEESGLGDVEGQVRWRWRRETAERPEVFSYAEIVTPNRDKVLIGTPGWEYKFGTGVIRGYAWGTLTARAAVEFATASSSPVDIGEYAIEYLKRLSPRWRVYMSVEGTQDETSFIGEAQWHLNEHVFVRLNTGVGLTPKALDWTPELGVVFAWGTRTGR